MSKRWLVLILGAMATEWRRAVTQDAKIGIENSVYAIFDALADDGTWKTFDRAKAQAFWVAETGQS